jgi:serine/threonine protein phosphatase 1
MQTLVIGDIHGCFHELQALLDRAGLVHGDAILSLGDCVDRGPETPQVLNFFREHPNAQALMGNHERKHVRGSRGEIALARSQQISKIQFGETYSEALAFMDGLPMYLNLPEALLVHGYLEPGLPVERQTPGSCAATEAAKNIYRPSMTGPGMSCTMGTSPSWWDTKITPAPTSPSCTASMSLAWTPAV